MIRVKVKIYSLVLVDKCQHLKLSRAAHKDGVTCKTCLKRPQRPETKLNYNGVIKT